MAKRSDRVERVLRIRELQHQQALGVRAQVEAKLTQITTMIQRIDQIQRAYSPVQGGIDADRLKAAAYQRIRLQAPRESSEAQRRAAARQLAAAEQAGQEAYRRKKAAEKLHEREQARERIEADRRAERNRLPRLPKFG